MLIWWLLLETGWSEVMLIWWLLLETGWSEVMLIWWLLLETEWSEVMLMWWFVSIKFNRCFLKFSFLLSLFKRFLVISNVTGKTVPLPSKDVTFFLWYFTQKCIIFFFSVAHFFNRIVKTKCKTPFSKLLKGYICTALLCNPLRFIIPSQFVIQTCRTL